MIFATDQQSMRIVCGALGVGKGIRSVYMSIVVPSYIPIERLASASAIQLFVNGFVMMCIGPILGMHSNAVCVILHNILVLYFIRFNKRQFGKLRWMHNFPKHLHNHHDHNVQYRNGLYLVPGKILTISKNSKFMIQKCIRFNIFFTMSNVQYPMSIQRYSNKLCYVIRTNLLIFI